MNLFVQSSEQVPRSREIRRSLLGALDRGHRPAAGASVPQSSRAVCVLTVFTRLAGGSNGRIPLA